VHFPSLLQFLQGLHDNNNRPWFLHNKPQYDILREEFTALVGEVGAKVRVFDDSVGAFDAKKAVFRIYRDVRFAKDKQPYKTNMGAVIGTRNMADKTRPVHYFHIDHRGVLLVASGIYNPDPATLKRLRDDIVANPKTLDRLLRNKAFVKTYGALSAEGRMTRVPKGYAADAPHTEYLKNRNFFCEVSIDLQKRLPKDLPAAISEKIADSMPVSEWLRGALLRTAGN
jgi:uncharacterized protein (TIGR02453 family)